MIFFINSTFGFFFFKEHPWTRKYVLKLSCYMDIIAFLERSQSMSQMLSQPPWLGFLPLSIYSIGHFVRKSVTFLDILVNEILTMLLRHIVNLVSSKATLWFISVSLIVRLNGFWERLKISKWFFCEDS